MNHSIRSVSRITGLPAHLIRVWERRYAAVIPTRTPTNRRVYSDDDVERLSLLGRATRGGHSIGDIAAWPTQRLRELTTGSSPPQAPEVAMLKESWRPEDSWMEDCLGAVKGMESQRLEATLQRATLALGTQGCLQRLVGPLSQAIGDQWRSGALTAAQEHFASALIRVFVAGIGRPFAPAENAPRLVVATPAGQLHELGALMVATVASTLGWHPIYLGPSLPAAEIAGAAIAHRARAVALSIVYPGDDPAIPAELDTLYRLLPPNIRIIVGGRAAEAYQASTHRVQALRARSLDELGVQLDQLRSSTLQASSAVQGGPP